MSTQKTTHAVRIFVKAAVAKNRHIKMKPRSENDKEYFPQDWFIDRLKDAGLPFEQQGRNSYPDFWVGQEAIIEGYEIKSLSFARERPARKDYDSNSTIPSGRKDNRDIFLAFFLYTGTGSSPRTVHTFSLAHADLINSDHTVADEHMNPAIHSFGSYANGFIRNRKMYVFPHPITIDPTGLGRCRLIVPESWSIRNKNLKKVGTIQRTISENAIESYTIRLHGRGEAEVNTIPYPNKGDVLAFDAFELA